MRIGIDLGGTKIEARALDEAGVELAKVRVATPSDDYNSTVAAIVDLVSGLESDLGRAESVGVGTPGAIDPVSGLLKNSNSVVLNGHPLDIDLATALRREIRMANDADCLAVSEAVDGAAAGARNVFAVILGTGVGGGVVANGKLVRGPNRIAGEWGHNPLPAMTDEERSGQVCYCGRLGCIEMFLSGPSLARDHAKRTGRKMTAADIAASAASDTDAATTMQIYYERLARALGSVINILDPEVIVLGGGVSNVTEIYTAVPAMWSDYVFSAQVLTKLVKAQHGDSSGVLGAARLWKM